MSLRIGAMLRDPAARQALRDHLLTYPGATEESTDMLMEAYAERADMKEHLLTERHMHNALAESWLDRKGYPRPPSWQSIFFYPDSFRLRNIYVFIAFVVGIVWAFVSG